MARRNLRPVDSEKHEITWSNLLQNASTVQDIVLAEGLAPVSVNAANEVTAGSTINSIYFEFHFSAASTGAPNVIHWTIHKQPFGTSANNPNVYFGQDKRFIFKRGMEMLPVNVSTVFKRIFVVKIPPRFRRMGKNDRLTFSYISSASETINACGIAIYKRYS